MKYLDKLTKDINVDIKGDGNGEEGKLSFIPLPARLITCTCPVGRKTIRAIVETGTVKGLKATSHKCSQKVKVVAGIWRKVVTDDDSSENGKGQLVLLQATAAGLKAAAKRYDSKRQDDDLGETIDGEDPGLGLDNVMDELYEHGFNFDDTFKLNMGSNVSYRSMVLLNRATQPVRALLFWFQR